MKQSPTKPCTGQSCPVRCRGCRFEGKVFPARWNRASLKMKQSFTAMAGNTNHILFLMKGVLHVRLRKNDNHYLTPGQYMFFARRETPEITACAPGEIIWLDFSNRVIFNQQDILSVLVGRGHPCRSGRSVLALRPQIRKLLEELQLFESPCLHLLKQYELFMHMTHAYSAEELTGFFRSILRPEDDLRAFVINNYRYMEGVEDFARNARMSKSCFIRKFRDAFGMTIHQWMVKQKEKDLCEMIRNGKRDTKEMARLLGMENPACLYQFCRKHFGCPIRELIARLSNNTQEDSRKEDS